MAGVEKDEHFYMTLVTIQVSQLCPLTFQALSLKESRQKVEDRLFRVPQQVLESQSRVFRDMFSLPQPEIVDGSGDDNPIRLEGIGKDEFKRFLEVLFSMGKPRKIALVFEMWFPVAKLAQMWECDGIYKYAIENMPYRLVCRSPAEKVGLAVKYDIKSWLLPGLNELAQRQAPLGMSDFEHLGPELTLKVAAVRESLAVRTDFDRKDRVRLVSGTRDASNVDFTSTIKRVFQISDNANSETPGEERKEEGSRSVRLLAR
ncbi:hypothetical protein JVU11DRAFT_7457 [Chiua virens]|nr:hypothetical protein JVU11DRAFT_7457 [Chiua virens]